MHQVTTFSSSICHQMARHCVIGNFLNKYSYKEDARKQISYWKQCKRTTSCKIFLQPHRGRAILYQFDHHLKDGAGSSFATISLFLLYNRTDNTNVFCFAVSK